MFGQLENLALVGALALEDRAGIVQRMGQDVDFGIPPLHHMAVHPNHAVTIVIGNKVRHTVQGPLRCRFSSGSHMPNFGAAIPSRRSLWLTLQAGSLQAATLIADAQQFDLKDETIKANKST